MSSTKNKSSDAALVSQLPIVYSKSKLYELQCEERLFYYRLATLLKYPQSPLTVALLDQGPRRCMFLDIPSETMQHIVRHQKGQLSKRQLKSLETATLRSLFHYSKKLKIDDLYAELQAMATARRCEAQKRLNIINMLYALVQALCPESLRSVVEVLAPMVRDYIIQQLREQADSENIESDLPDDADAPVGSSSSQSDKKDDTDSESDEDDGEGDEDGRSRSRSESEEDEVDSESSSDGEDEKSRKGDESSSTAVDQPETTTADSTTKRSSSSSRKHKSKPISSSRRRSDSSSSDAEEEQTMETTASSGTTNFACCQKVHAAAEEKARHSVVNSTNPTGVDSCPIIQSPLAPLLNAAVGMLSSLNRPTQAQAQAPNADAARAMQMALFKMLSDVSRASTGSSASAKPSSAASAPQSSEFKISPASITPAPSSTSTPQPSTSDATPSKPSEAVKTD